MVIKETKSALLLLAVLHLATFAIMAGYRYHTQQYYIAEASIAREFALKAQAQAQEQAVLAREKALLAREKKKVAVAAAREKKKKKKKSIAKRQQNETNPMEQYEDPVKKISKSISEAQESVFDRMEEIRTQMHKLKRLEKDAEDLMASALSNSEKEIDYVDDGSSVAGMQSPLELDHWKGFLSVGSLREIPDDDLPDFFFDAATEIMAIVEEFDDDDDDATKKATISRTNKLAKQFVFDTSLGAKIVKKPIKFVCPVPPVKDSDENNDRNLQRRRTRNNNAAYESDLEDYLKKFEKKFRNRIQARGIHALLPESIELLEEKIDQKMNILLEDIYEFADTLEEQLEMKTANANANSNNGEVTSSCIDPDLVAELVSAGLNAQMAHADVREALRKSILRYDPHLSEDELILDADLDAIGGRSSKGGKSGAGSTVSRDKPLIESINLRDTIDTPLLMKSVDWIDALIDVVGGYSDGLDQYLDNLTGFHGTSSVGEIVVEGILERADKVGDVNIGKILPITGKR